MITIAILVLVAIISFTLIPYIQTTQDQTKIKNHIEALGGKLIEMNSSKIRLEEDNETYRCYDIKYEYEENLKTSYCKVGGPNCIELTEARKIKTHPNERLAEQGIAHNAGKRPPLS